MNKTKDEYSEQLIRGMHHAFNILGDGWELNEEMSDVYDQALKVAQEYADQNAEILIDALKYVVLMIVEWEDGQGSAGDKLLRIKRRFKETYYLRS